MAESINRFKDLLDPIRDLAANWDVDIADSLDVYLDELESLQLSFAGGDTNLNFAEAALLIQGSTSIYSRKVEYLYKLVMQSLEFISNQKSKENGTSGKNKGNNTNNSMIDEERLLFGNDPSYLLLDNDIDIAENIDLPNHDETQNQQIGARRNSSRLSTTGESFKNSMVLVHSILHEDHGTNNLKMSTCKMDHNGALVIGGLLDNQDEAIFPHREFEVHFGENEFVNMSEAGDDGDYGGYGGDDNYGDYYDTDAVEGPYKKDNDNQISNVEHAVDTIDSNGLTIQHVPHFPFPFPLPSAIADFQINPLAVLPPNNDVVVADPANIDIQPAVMKEKEVLKPRQQKKKNPLHHQPLLLLDPHEVTSNSRPIRKGRPFAIPRRLLILEKIERARKNNHGDIDKIEEEARVKLAALEKNDNTKFLESLGVYHTVRHVSNEAISPKIPTSGLINPNSKVIIKAYRRLQSRNSFIQRMNALEINDSDLEDSDNENEEEEDDFIYRRPAEQMVVQEQNTSRREKKQERAEFGFEDEDRPGVDRWMDNEVINTSTRHDGDNFKSLTGGSGDVDYNIHTQKVEAGNEHDNDFNGYGDDNGYGGYDDDNGNYDDGDYNAGAEMGSSSSSTKFDPFFNEDEDLARRVERALEESLSQTQGNSYEMLCKKHIEGFMKGAERYARETQLSKRVHDWTMRLEPVLRTQELAPSFDIHEYSQRLLVQFDELSRDRAPDQTTRKNNSKKGFSNDVVVGFAEVVAGQTSGEVCRSFLATLQLANSGNIDIIPPTPIHTPVSFSRSKPNSSASSSSSSSSMVGRQHGGADLPDEIFQVRVITTEKRNDFENYFAPSLVEK